MPVMYHFRIDKDISAKPEKDAYKFLVADLEKHNLNHFFEFSAKAKDMNDGKGIVFRFTAKVKAEGEVDEKTFNDKVVELESLLNKSYGIDLSDVYTTRAKLKNTIMKNSKTIQDAIFTRLSETVKQTVRFAPINTSQMCDKMGEMWADDSEHNIFKEVDALSNSNELNETRERLSMEQEELDAKLTAAKAANQQLAEINSSINETILQLDNSTLVGASQAMVNNQRSKEIDAKQIIAEKVYPDHNRDDFDSFRRISIASAKINGIQTFKKVMRESINHQHKTKGTFGTTNEKSKAKQAFDEAFFDSHLESTAQALKQTKVDALTQARDEVSIQFSKIERTHRQIEGETPDKIAADIKVSKDELAKLTTALTIQKAFEARYKEENAVTHAFNDTPPPQIETSALVSDTEHTDTEDASSDEEQPSVTSTEQENLPMYHFRIEQQIVFSQKKAFEEVQRVLEDVAKKRTNPASLFEVRIKTYKETERLGSPTYFMLRATNKEPQSTLAFSNEITAIMRICAAHGIDVQAFTGEGSKQKTQSDKKFYVTPAGANILNGILKTVKQTFPSKPFDRVKAVLPQNDEAQNDFLKIDRLVQGRGLIHEQQLLSQEKEHLEEELAQVNAMESVQKELLERIQATQAGINDVSSAKIDEGTKQWVDTLKAEATTLSEEYRSLPKSQAIKHSGKPMSDYSDLFSIQKYNTIFKSPLHAVKTILKDAEKNVSKITESGFMRSSSSKPSELASAALTSHFDDAIITAQQKLATVKTTHDDTCVLFAEINGLNPSDPQADSLKNTINSKKSAMELHAENRILNQQLAKLQLTSDLALGIQLTKQKTPPPVPSFSPEEELQKKDAAQVTAELEKNVVNSAMPGAMENLLTSKTKSKVGAEIPFEAIRTASPNGKPADWKPPPPPRKSAMPFDLKNSLETGKRDLKSIIESAIEQAPTKQKSMDEVMRNRQAKIGATPNTTTPPINPDSPVNNASKEQPPKREMKLNLMDQLKAGQSILKSKKPAEMVKQGAPPTTSSAQNDKKPVENELLKAIKNNQRRGSASNAIDVHQETRRAANAAKQTEKRKNSILGGIEGKTTLKRVTPEMQAEDIKAKEEQRRDASLLGSASALILARRNAVNPNDNDSDNDNESVNPDWIDDDDTITASSNIQNSASSYSEQGSHSSALFQENGASSSTSAPVQEDELDKDKDKGPGRNSPGK